LTKFGLIFIDDTRDAVFVASNSIKLEFVISDRTLATSIITNDFDYDLVARVILVLDKHTLSSDSGASKTKHSTDSLFNLEIKMDRLRELVGLVDVDFSTSSKKRHASIAILHLIVKNVVF
jgi:hypothetical protein